MRKISRGYVYFVPERRSKEIVFVSKSLFFLTKTKLVMAITKTKKIKINFLFITKTYILTIHFLYFKGFCPTGFAYRLVKFNQFIFILKSFLSLTILFIFCFILYPVSFNSKSAYFLGV
tara:strand:- start:17137 stop:17493 length:357 start_codon:yes stop_codon:yes gene_type:complete